jgi:hypothetical protein
MFKFEQCLYVNNIMLWWACGCIVVLYNGEGESLLDFFLDSENLACAVESAVHHREGEQLQAGW